jgi:hypothetical protein
MTKEEAREFKMRWRLVNRVTAAEVRRMSVAFKLQQLALLFEAAQVFDPGGQRRASETEVRARWQRLRERFHV